MKYGVGARGALLACSSALIAFAALCGPAHAIYINHRAAADLGFENLWDQDNLFSATVAISFENGKYCTGTLIDPRTVVTASHCLATSDNHINSNVLGFEIRFGPDAAVSTPHDRRVGGALIHPDYDSAIFGPHDIALLSLDAPVTGIEPVALALDSAMLPSFGDVLVIAGYGGAGIAGKQIDIDFFRRVAMMNYIGVDHVSAATPMIFTLFRDPDDPASYDRFGLVEAGIEVPYLQGSAAPGDSGGPIYMFRDGQYWQIGTVIGGTQAPPPDYNPYIPDYGIINLFSPVAYYADWLEAWMAYRAVAVAPGDRLWSDPDSWLDRLGRREVPDNVAGSYAGRGDLGRFYGVRLAQPGRLTLDIDPTIDDLSLLGSGAALAIGAERSLAVIGGTWVDQGVIQLSGRLETGELVARGGEVRGSGTLAVDRGVFNLAGTVVSGEGGPTGGLRIEGDYVQGIDGTLVVALGEQSASAMVVTETADLDGTLFLTRGEELVKAGVRHDLVIADARYGIFAHLVSGLEFFSPTVAYSDTGVDGGFERNAVTFAQRAEGPNQRAVASVLETMDPESSVYRGVLNARTGTAGTALASLSAQPYADTGVALMRQSMRIRDAIAYKSNRVALGAAEEGDTAAGPEGWVMMQTLRGDLEGVHHGAHGVFGGIGAGGAGWDAGLVLGFTEASITGRGPTFSQASAQSVHLGLEAAARVQGFDLAAAGLYSHHGVSLNRTLAVAGLDPSAEASYSAGTLQLYGEIARELNLTDLSSLTPFAGLSWANHRLGGFRDSAGPATLTVASGNFVETILALGLRAEATLHADDRLTVTGHGGVAGHMGLGEFSPILTASFDAGEAFSSTGISGGRQNLAVQAGLDFSFEGGANLDVTYAGAFGTDRKEHSFRFRLSAQF